MDSFRGGLSGRVSSDVCVWVRVRRFRGWLSGRVLSELCAEVRMIFCLAPEVRIIFLSGAGSKNHLLVKLTFISA